MGKSGLWSIIKTCSILTSLFILHAFSVLLMNNTNKACQKILLIWPFWSDRLVQLHFSMRKLKYIEKQPITCTSIAFRYVALGLKSIMSLLSISEKEMKKYEIHFPHQNLLNFSHRNDDFWAGKYEFPRRTWRQHFFRLVSSCARAWGTNELTVLTGFIECFIIVLCLN